LGKFQVFKPCNYQERHKMDEYLHLVNKKAYFTLSFSSVSY